MEKIKVGDVILTHDSKFIPKGIQFFMRKYARKLKLKVSKTYNHAAVVIEWWGEVLIAESAEKGVRAIYTMDEYRVKHPDLIVLTWKKPLSKEEQVTFSKIATKYLSKITRYDFANFFRQIQKSFSLKWKGKKGEKSKKRQYCSEFAAVCMDETRGTFGGVTWDKNPLDIQICPELEIQNKL